MIDVNTTFPIIILYRNGLKAPNKKQRLTNSILLYPLSYQSWLFQQTQNITSGQWLSKEYEDPLSKHRVLNRCICNRTLGKKICGGDKNMLLAIPYGSLHQNSPHRLMYLNTWSLVGSDIWELWLCWWTYVTRVRLWSFKASYPTPPHPTLLLASVQGRSPQLLLQPLCLLLAAMPATMTDY